MVDAPLHSPPAGESDAPPVTLCCASADEATVREAADGLTTRGQQVQLAIGVDVDESVLVKAIEAHQGRGLYVLCRGSMLDRGAVDHLREVLRERDVPFGRTLTLAVDPQRARELEERIVSVLRRMVTGRHDVRARTWGSSAPSPGQDGSDATVHPLGTGSDPAIALRGPAASPARTDPFAATQIEPSGIMPPEYTGVDHTAVASGSSSDVSSAPAAAPLPRSVPVAPVDSAPIAAIGSAPRPAAGMPAAPSTAPSVGAAALAPIAPSPGASSPGTVASSDDALSIEGSSAPVVAPSMPGSPAPRGPYASPGADDSSADFEPPLTVGGRMGRALGSPAGLAAVIGGLVVVVLVVVLAGVFGGDDEDPAQASSDKTTAPSKDEAKADEAKADEAKADEAKADEAKADEASVPPGDDGGEPAAAEPEATDEPEAAAAEVTEPEATEPIAATTEPDEDPPEVVEALKNREVRAIDIFLVAPERKGSLAYEAAVDYCNALDVASLTGWRVPTIGELNTVGTARMLGKSIYWSSTLGDAFGDLMLVLNTKKDRISVVTKGWEGAKITCIRPRRP